MKLINLKSYGLVNYIHLEGKSFQIFYIGLSLNFMLNSGKILLILT